MLVVFESDFLYTAQEQNLFLHTPLFFRQQMVRVPHARSRPAVPALGFSDVAAAAHLPLGRPVAHAGACCLPVDDGGNPGLLGVLPEAARCPLRRHLRHHRRHVDGMVGSTFNVQCSTFTVHRSCRLRRLSAFRLLWPMGNRPHGVFRQEAPSVCCHCRRHRRPLGVLLHHLSRDEYRLSRASAACLLPSVRPLYS